MDISVEISCDNCDHYKMYISESVVLAGSLISIIIIIIIIIHYTSRLVLYIN